MDWPLAAIPVAVVPFIIKLVGWVDEFPMGFLDGSSETSISPKRKKN